MKNLDQQEISRVSGGNPVIIGIGIGIGSSYAYEHMGGKEGIDEFLEKSWESASSSARYWGRKVERFFGVKKH